MPETVAIVHNKVPARIRVRIPLIRNKRTMAELLKHSLLGDVKAKGIYHAEPNITTGTVLIKYHPALHTETEVIERIRAIARNISTGTIEITAKHKNPKLGKMQPQAFFTRELIVSIAGNIIAGFVLAALISRG
ncbi:HMA2 domain-containing protein [Methylocaldum marinum]|nr:hypothetical protein [Methylocaldum marinum]